MGWPAVADELAKGIVYMGLGRSVVAGAVLILLVLAFLGRADEEATCSNGRRVRGTLTLADGGTLRFLPTGQDTPLPANGIEGIRFDASPAITPRAGNSLRALLADGQHVTGELLKLDGERVQLRSAWSERVVVKRNAVVALTHPPGFRIVVADDFNNNAKSWKRTGETLAYDLPAAQEAGRVGVTFEENDKTAAAGSLFEAVFQTQAGARTVKVTIARIDENYQVETADLKGEAREVRRTAGPHQLAVQFSKQSLRVTCDEEVLWFNIDQGPGGSLKQVRLTGGAAWSAFYLAQAVDDPRHPPGDAEQDEVWLASDDQLFGSVAGADSRAIELEGRFAKRSFAWAEVRGIYFRRSKPRATKPEANTVRVCLRTGFGAEADILDGVLLKLDERQFTLKHAELGQLSLDRKWLRELRPVVDRK
jgi:hypothetical protein